jgi:hypothetical protein
MYPCPCCGYDVYSEPPGSYEICPICFWEDDIVQLAFPDLKGGANKCSLIEGQQTFARIGSCEERVKSHVRPPQSTDSRNSDWRPIDPSRDRYLHSRAQEDCELWDTVKNSRDCCLYYWSPKYWLSERTD